MKKRILSLLLISTMLIAGTSLLSGCAAVQALPAKISEFLNPTDPLVYGVREAVQEDYRLTYGDTFDYFFTNSEWTSFTTKQGVDVVEFTGYCYFRETYVHAQIQFTITEDGLHFEATYLALNGQTQTEEVLGILLTDAFSAYQRSGR